MSVPETASNINTCTKTVWRMIAAGELPGVIRLGRRVLISRKALEEWIAASCPPIQRPHRAGKRKAPAMARKPQPVPTTSFGLAMPPE
jgi:excisionase family DNA binding protein